MNIVSEVCMLQVYKIDSVSKFISPFPIYSVLQDDMLDEMRSIELKKARQKTFKNYEGFIVDNIK